MAQLVAEEMRFELGWNSTSTTHRFSVFNKIFYSQVIVIENEASLFPGIELTNPGYGQGSGPSYELETGGYDQGSTGQGNLQVI